MNSLQKMFPSLALFSDLDWEAVTKEYEAEYADMSFPEYLQQKALDGDCPPYLFELAFYELAVFDAKTSMEAFPETSGIHLNPTALFLSLEFDIKRMMEDAAEGKIEVYERQHVLCIFKDKKDQFHIFEVTEDELELLQHLEDGPQKSNNFVRKSSKADFDKFVTAGLILEQI